MRIFCDRRAAVLLGFAVVLTVVAISQPPALAQGTRSDYQRAAETMATDARQGVFATARSTTVVQRWQPVLVSGGERSDSCEFVLVDAGKGRPARRVAPLSAGRSPRQGCAFRTCGPTGCRSVNCYFHLKEREVDFRNQR